MLFTPALLYRCLLWITLFFFRCTLNKTFKRFHRLDNLPIGSSYNLVPSNCSHIGRTQGQTAHCPVKNSTFSTATSPHVRMTAAKCLHVQCILWATWFTEECLLHHTPPTFHILGCVGLKVHAFVSCLCSHTAWHNRQRGQKVSCAVVVKSPMFCEIPMEW